MGSLYFHYVGNLKEGKNLACLPIMLLLRNKPKSASEFVSESKSDNIYNDLKRCSIKIRSHRNSSVYIFSADVQAKSEISIKKNPQTKDSLQKSILRVNFKAQLLCKPKIYDRDALIT